MRKLQYTVTLLQSVTFSPCDIIYNTPTLILCGTTILPSYPVLPRLILNKIDSCHALLFPILNAIDPRPVPESHYRHSYWLSILRLITLIRFNTQRNWSPPCSTSVDTQRHTATLFQSLALRQFDTHQNPTSPCVPTFDTQEESLALRSALLSITPSPV